MRKPAFVLLGALVLAAPAFGQLVGASGNGKIYEIDPASGRIGFTGPSGFTGYDGMTHLATGVPVSTTDAPVPRFVRHNTFTGKGDLHFSPFLNGIAAIAYAPDGTLYAVANDAAKSRLYSYASTGAPSVLVGELPAHAVVGLDFAPDGTLYGWSTNWGLTAIDPATAACSNVNGLLDGSSAIQSLAICADGSAFGSYYELYSIDLPTGAVVLVSAVGYTDLRGLTCLPDTRPSFVESPPDAPLSGSVQVDLRGPADGPFCVLIAPQKVTVLTPFVLLDVGPVGGLQVVLTGTFDPLGDAYALLPITDDPTFSGATYFCQSVALDLAAGLVRKSNVQTLKIH